MIPYDRMTLQQQAILLGDTLAFEDGRLKKEGKAKTFMGKAMKDLMNNADKKLEEQE